MGFPLNNWHIKYQGHINLSLYHWHIKNWRNTWVFLWITDTLSIKVTYICLCIIDTLRTGGTNGFPLNHWHINPLTAGAEYIGLLTQLLQLSVPPFKHVKAIMWHQSSRFEKSWPQFCQIWVIFTHLKLWIASARHNFNRVKIPIE